MDVRRRHRQIYDQENVHAIRGKPNALPAKKQGPTVRGALGELNANVQAQRESPEWSSTSGKGNIGKVAVTTAEFEKKASLFRSRSYNHVQSKIDTGLTGKNVVIPPRREEVSARPPLRREEVTARPPLRREESTASHAAKAILRIKGTAKENTRPTNKDKEDKDSTTIGKKEETKKTNTTKIKEKNIIKPALKESTKTLQKLKINETSSIINVARLQQVSQILDTTPELPPHIEDIDVSDHDPVVLMTPYIKDIYRYLMELEMKYQIVPDHLKNQKNITSKMRSTLLDWLVEVHQQFKLALETFHMTVGIIDRYLQEDSNVTRNQLQLVGVTAMFIASKYEDVYPPDLEDFVYVTDKSYTKQELIRCERDIIMKLKFCLARPIPLSFLRRFVKAAHGTSKNHHLAKYFVDLCLIDYSMAHYRPSMLSAAALCLSLYLLSNNHLEDIWTPSLEFYSTYKLHQIKPIMKQIAKIVANVEKSVHVAVYKKYQEPSLAKVATLPQLKSEALYELAELPIE